MSYHIIEKPAFHIVGIRMNLVDDMEENQKNVPLFWEQALNDRRFSELCELNNAAPNGILGISVYENPENIFYYIERPAPIRHLMEYANMKFPPLHGLFLKTMDISKRMSNQSLEDFIRNGCLFRGTSMPVCRTLKYILSKTKQSSPAIPKYGLL